MNNVEWVNFIRLLIGFIININRLYSINKFRMILNRKFCYLLTHLNILPYETTHNFNKKKSQSICLSNLFKEIQTNEKKIEYSVKLVNITIY